MVHESLPYGLCLSVHALSCGLAVINLPRFRVGKLNLYREGAQLFQPHHRVEDAIESWLRSVNMKCTA